MEEGSYLKKFPIGFQWQRGSCHYEVVGHEKITKDIIEYRRVKKRWTYISHHVKMFDTNDFRLGVIYNRNMSTKKIEKMLRLIGYKETYFDDSLFEI